ncbi:MAG: ferritin-like domain-containing protein [Thermaerobacter sp.]|nr:ferritin-like domain-containing protein [Thermaerobacter sp.]
MWSAPNQDPTFAQLLEESIQDELSDVQFYANIANEAPDSLSRILITSITGDEYGHARTQAALLHALNPNSAGGTPVPPPPNTGYVQDVMAAVAGETSAVNRYAYLASIAPTLEIRYILTSILGDEYGHIRTWLALLQNAVTA